MTAIKALFSSTKRARPTRLVLFTLAGGLLIAVAACAPQEEVFNARLSPFPVIGANAGGLGEATAVLRGTTLEVTGSFEGLTFRVGRGGEVTGATAANARLYAGSVMAVVGEQFADLALTAEGEGDAGMISGSVELTAEQVEMLRNGQIYAQVGSEDAPDGHLWGWFLQ